MRMRNASFIDSLQTKDTFTENAMPAHSTTGSALVDMFFNMGAARSRSEADLVRWFVRSFGEDSLLALKAMFYNRDIRGGQGERRSFRTFFKYLCENHPNTAIRNIDNVIKFGRWDDLFVAMDTPVENAVLERIATSLWRGDRLCSKWMPRDNKANSHIAHKIRKFMGLSPRGYRKLLAGNTEVVESLMCDNKWENIDYNVVPSVAMNRYRNAFKRHDTDGFVEWLGELSKPVEERKEGVKVNAKTLYPYEIVSPLMGVYGLGYGSTARRATRDEDEIRLLEAQWEALPDYMPKGRQILPVCDVSGSMFTLGRPSPIEVCVSLGLYLAERNVGPYKDAFITFSESPKLQVLRSKRLVDKVREVMTSDWGMNTNLEAVFNLILNSAKRDKLPAEDMPEAILILSDMQFDSCVQNRSNSALEMIDLMYAEAGYTRPQVIFWNLRSTDNVPVKFDATGTALVSGFSPSIMKSIMIGNDINPYSVILNTLNQERYNSVVT